MSATASRRPPTDGAPVRLGIVTLPVTLLDLPTDELTAMAQIGTMVVDDEVIPFGIRTIKYDLDAGFSINGDFSGSTRSDGTSALVEAGLSAQRGALSLSGGLNWQDGGALKGYLGGQLNIAYRW